MTAQPNTTYLGVDCGGSACRVLWQDGPRRVDFVGKGANFTTDPEGCALAITAALEALADKAGAGLGDICSAQAYLGVAGLLRKADAEALDRALPLSHARIEDDRRALVVGALGPVDGFVAALGTGSFFVRRAGEALTGIGGWGLVLGDEGSGAWLGRSLMSYVLHAVDTLEDPSAFSKAVLDEMGGTSGIVAFARDAHPHEFARLAPGIAAAAEAGDLCGQELMRRGADWIAMAVRRLGWAPGARLVLPGKLGQSYVPWLPEDARASVEAPKGEAVEGALWLAQGCA